MIEFLTVEEVAIALQISTATVRNLCNRGRFPNAAKIDPQRPHSTWRIPRQDLDAYTKATPTHERSETN